MVTVGALGQLAAEIRIEASAGRHEVYELEINDSAHGHDWWTYQNPRYVLRE
jgi:hypothetical protein